MTVTPAGIGVPAKRALTKVGVRFIILTPIALLRNCRKRRLGVVKTPEKVYAIVTSPALMYSIAGE
jgi:hypothetical protein